MYCRNRRKFCGELDTNRNCTQSGKHNINSPDTTPNQNTIDANVKLDSRCSDTPDILRSLRTNGSINNSLKADGKIDG